MRILCAFRSSTGMDESLGFMSVRRDFLAALRVAISVAWDSEP